MSVDREYRIRVSTVADNSGTEVTKQGLKDVKAGIQDGVNPALAEYSKTEGKVAEGARDMEVSHRGMHKALALVGPEVAHVGMELMTAFASPQMMAIMGVAVAIKGLDELMKSQIEMDTSKIGAHSLSAGLADMAKVATDARVVLDDLFRTLGEGASAEQQLGDETARATALAKAQEEAAKGQDDAEKELALANLEKAKAEGAVTDAEYQSLKAVINNHAERQKLDRDQAARKEALARTGAEAKAQQGLSEEAAGKLPEAKEKADATRLAAEANQRRIDNAKKNIKEFEEAIAQDKSDHAMTPKQRTGIEASLAQDKGLLEAFQGNQSGLQSAANAAADDFAKLSATAKEAKKKAEEGQAKYETDQAVDKTRTAAEEKTFGTRSKAGVVAAQAKSEADLLNSDEGKWVKRVAELENAASSGHASQGQLRELQQMKQQYARMHDAQGSAMLGALQAGHDSMQTVTKHVLAMTARLQQVEKQLKNTAGY